MLLSVVVPVFNEESIIGNFIDSLTKELAGEKNSYELILVENGSTDKTLRILRDKEKTNHHLLVFHLPKPSYGKALKCGLKKAKGEYIVVFNVDFWEPIFIEMAVKNDPGGVDVIVGSKNLPESKDKRPFTRKLITKIFLYFLKIFFDFKGTDTHGIKIFRKKVVSNLLGKCKLNNSLFDTELLIRSQRAGFKILEVPVEIKEIRPPRFKRRLLDTPKEICELFLALR